MAEERIEKITKLLKVNKTMKIKDISSELNISISTIRRDLNFLEENGTLRRIHGGATLNERIRDENQSLREGKNKREKEEIGRVAGECVKDGDFIFIDSGTTTIKMIPYLRDKDVIVVTNSIENLWELQKYNITTYILGGLVKEKTRAIVGEEAIESLSKYNFDKAFLGGNAIDIKSGITTPEVSEGAVKKKVVEKSQVAYILADSSKFDNISSIKFADLEDVIIITDRLSNKDYLEKTKVKECVL